MTDGPLDLARYRDALADFNEIPEVGFVVQVVGLTIEATGPRAGTGETVLLHPDGAPPLAAEVVGFRNRRLLLMPLGELAGIAPGTRVTQQVGGVGVPTGRELLGRVLDPFGRPLDDRGPLQTAQRRGVQAPPPNPMARRRIEQPLSLGVRVIDALFTCGRGQRLGIFAGSGVGKSTLLGMMARQASADVNVIALIGERGREVREFLERDLGPEGLSRSVVVVATSDQPALLRLRGALAATSIAEAFRDDGADVLFMMDSVTRFAAAQREVGLAVGEPPATKGYPPSVFALLPRLLERTGPGRLGTITALYTILVEGDDMNDPIADTVRGILDGHIVLARRLAERGHYPAVDVLASVSRSMPDVVQPQQLALASRVVELVAALHETQDLLSIGAYVRGSNRRVDEAIEREAEIEAFLRQARNESCTLEEAAEQLQQLFATPWIPPSEPT